MHTLTIKRISFGVLILLWTATEVAPNSRIRAQQIPARSSINLAKDSVLVTVPEYEVSTVKVHKGEDRNMNVATRDDSFSASNLSLTTLLSYAYNSRPDLISGGPGWLASTRFDVEAKISGGDVEKMRKLSSEQRRSMMRKVLQEHFNLALHTETKMLPVYELVAGKDGVKMQTSAAFPDADVKPEDRKAPHGSLRSAPGSVEGQGVPITSITAQLAFILQRSVIDKTGLQGSYDFTLKWRPEQLPSPRAENAPEDGPSIFTAVQEQLGLKLQPSKGPVEVLVIDRAEMPTPN
jgi:uncharacterized protein (TIGR03435 family)